MKISNGSECRRQVQYRYFVCFVAGDEGDGWGRRWLLEFDFCRKSVCSGVFVAGALIVVAAIE